MFSALQSSVWYKNKGETPDPPLSLRRVLTAPTSLFTCKLAVSSQLDWLIGTLRSNHMTAMRTSLEKGICVLSVFIMQLFLPT